MLLMNDLPPILPKEHDIISDAIGPLDFLQAPAVLFQEARLADALPPSTNFAAVRQLTDRNLNPSERHRRIDG